MTPRTFRLPGASDPSPRLLLAASTLAGLSVRQASRELGIDCLEATTPDEPFDSLVERALAAHCRALHPGECEPARQLALALACRRGGLAFIGPPPALIEAMCDGQAMCQLMREAGLPLASPGMAGEVVRVPVLADGGGRVRYLPARHAPRADLVMAPVAGLTLERHAYLGRLAVQGVASIGLEGLVTLSFRVGDNRIGFMAMTPGLSGSEALDEALTGLDPVVEQLRLGAGERLRARQPSLAPRGHALQWRLCLDPGAAFSGGPGLRLDRPPEAPDAARLLARGRQPEDAARRARRALEELLGASRARSLMTAVPRGWR
ncbi:hypothetical protein [Halomonas sp. C05BenzN]|uniref:ATP-binding protein n=1 Tax=Halomonas sp. C05BenzN TaxID=3411041 RepID=UPI003B94A353